jgi:hypothetical protein
MRSTRLANPSARLLAETLPERLIRTLIVLLAAVLAGAAAFLAHHGFLQTLAGQAKSAPFALAMAVGLLLMAQQLWCRREQLVR